MDILICLYFDEDYWNNQTNIDWLRPQGPVTIERIKKQIQEELSVSHNSRAVTFQYYWDMCPSGPRKTAAARLRNDYLNFIKSFF